MSVIGLSLSQREKDLIMDSWENLSNDYKNLAHIFYGHLFTLAPNLRLLFKGDIQSQQLKFIDSFDFLIRRMEDLTESTKKMKKLGLKHKGYGAKKSHYNIFWKALHHTFEFYLKSDFTEELQVAWEKLYDSVAEFMILGSRRK